MINYSERKLSLFSTSGREFTLFTTSGAFITRISTINHSSNQGPAAIKALKGGFKTIRSHPRRDAISDAIEIIVLERKITRFSF